MQVFMFSFFSFFFFASHIFLSEVFNCYLKSVDIVSFLHPGENPTRIVNFLTLITLTKPLPSGWDSIVRQDKVCIYIYYSD
ncbi:hypothetical protein CXB51_028188 [Gossypium anomalum]|uniref:Secreted protein n=1 Tax=Gossypium anomalum TaxID=47600 RepID=A0A8J6CN44_9ROSI|nr:hypothetical protein CXB51_028188 [Gossypium anomalum]